MTEVWCHRFIHRRSRKGLEGSGHQELVTKAHHAEESRLTFCYGDMGASGGL